MESKKSLNLFVFYLRAALAWFWFLIASMVVFGALPFNWKNLGLNSLFARLLERVALPILGWRVRVENLKGAYLYQPCVYVGNHQSNYDIFVMSPAYPANTAVVGKKELRKVPFFGFFFDKSGNITIDRDNRQDALSGMESARKAIQERKISVFMYPEGHRSKGADQMLPFKKGAFRLAIAAQVPIVPIVCTPLKKYFDPNLDPFETKQIIARVLPPIPTVGLTAADVETLMNDVRSKMEKELARL